MSRLHNLFLKAQEYIPGGVNSPVRAFNGVGGDPIFFKEAYGAYLIGEDNREYVDYVGSWGPMIAGHSHPYILQAVNKAIKKGLSFGAPTVLETDLARKICELMPSIEKIRFVNSGTEASMSAIRLARGFTSKNKIIKFNGCYHGHSDGLLVKAGSGLLTLGHPSSAGVPDSVVEHTLVAEFNQLPTVQQLFEKYKNEIAAVIVEPIAGNMNCILPLPDFLMGLRHLCDQYKSLLIFDEVITGFRVGIGGAQAYYNIKPDLTILGKIIGGGMPVGAFGGRKEIMELIAPLGPVYQAGTLSGNPIAMTAGLATLEVVTTPGFYEKITKTNEQLMFGLTKLAKTAGIPFHAVFLGGLFGLFFSPRPITTYQEMKHYHVSLFKRFFHGMLQEGIYFAPSPFESGFISYTHSDKEIAKTFYAAQKVFAELSLRTTC